MCRERESEEGNWREGDARGGVFLCASLALSSWIFPQRAALYVSCGGWSV